MENYVYLNEIKPVWSLMIVLYPYITGLVAGAFIVASLYHVFNNNSLKPVSKISLIAAFSFLLFATMPLLVHLGHPERAFNIMFTPHFTSAMSGFGFIYSFYLILLTIEIWLIFRKDIIAKAKSSSSFLIRSLFKLCTLGVYDTSPARIQLDKKIIYILSVIGIPAACILHGYVGFLFGALKSNPWWETPLMPLIFILSAIVSGIALLILFYTIICKIKGVAIKYDCLDTMVGFLFGFFILDFTLELLELLVLFYVQEEHLEALHYLISHRLMETMIYGQILAFSVGPLILLFIAIFFKKFISRGIYIFLTTLSSLALLIQVLLMRWNVVIGGQLVSKSMRGFTKFDIEWLGREGLLVGTIIILMPFIVFTIISKLIPLYDDL